MPTRTTALHGFTLEPPRSRPVAAISPDEISRVVGGLIRLDGRGSSSEDGAELTYSWSFAGTPLGSTTVEIVSVEEDGSVVTFIPDVTGLYTVSLVVSTPYRSSEAATAVVEATSVLLPVSSRTTPDGSIMFNVISSFWKMVDENALLSTIWSGYMQLTGADLLRLFQVDSTKSIATIQDLFQRRWLNYAPKLELDSTQCTGVFGGHCSGSSAYTVSGTVAATGIIISPTEIVLLDGTATPSGVGEELRVYSSDGSPGNIGSYLINRLNSDASGYIVSTATPFPSPTDDLIRTASTLVSYTGSDVVYDSDLTVDFVALGVVVGDVLRLEGGADSGYFRILAVGVPDGLTTNRHLQVERAATVSSSGRRYSIFNLVRISAARTSRAATSSVYIPSTEADLSVFESRVLVGVGSAVGPFEVLVESRHVLSAMAGQRISFTSGGLSGRSVTITGVNSAGTGYLLGASLGITAFPLTCAYSLTSPASIANRLLILDGEAYEIVGAEYDSGTPVEDGGRGAAWVVTLNAESVPTGREGMEWRVAAVLSTTEHTDVEDLGVTYGDLLLFEVARTDTSFVGYLPCFILGAAGAKLAFDFGTTSVAGSNGSLTLQEILDVAEALRIPRVYEDDTGAIQVAMIAADIQSAIAVGEIESAYGNLPLTSTTVIDLGDYQVRLSVQKILRNCRIPVSDELISAPTLFEYIAEPVVGTADDGTVTLVTAYGTTTELQRAPLELVENRDYIVSSDASTSGVNLETTAGAALLTIPYGDLIDRDLRVGDHIDIESGFDQGRYYIQEVFYDSVHARTAEGAVPLHTATGLRYTLQRRTPGTFIRFVDGLFTAASPAPDNLWAQISLFDNNELIEDNFGVLVGVTKEQLDEYGTSQISYRGAVRALMYAWTSGPTVRNVTVGTHVLMGLPVTEVRGRVLQVDDVYDGTKGRALIEDIDGGGNGTGLVRVYYYQNTQGDGLTDFSGLAENPHTGAVYAVSDEVPPLSALSKGILVDDYLTDPVWWRSSVARGADELQKFHTWQVLVDAAQVDSRDMPLILNFCNGIRPVYTKPRVVLVRYLADELAVEDVLALEGTAFLSDDPVLSVEATHMVDSYNGSGLPHRLFDYGSLATRTLFEGVDLETAAGSGVVTSARGGFQNALSEPPLPHAPGEPVGLLPGINASFQDDTCFRGTPLVRAGDILFIRGGNNLGRYVVVSVDSDTQLTVDELPDFPPSTKPVAEIEASTGQVFQIQRVDSALVTTGSALIMATTLTSTTIESADGNFRWNGVAVGDLLVVTSGADYGVHEVLEVGEWVLGHRESLDTRLVISGVLVELGIFTFEILREGLRTNPVSAGTDGVLAIGSNLLTSAASAFQLLHLLPGDMVEIQSGVCVGQAFDVLDVISDTEIFLDHVFGVNEVAVQFRVLRPGIFEDGDPRDGDWELEKFCVHDDVDMEIIEPRTLVIAVADLTLAIDSTDPNPANWTATATSAATDLQAAGVLAGDKLSIDNVHANSGTYAVASVSGHEVEIEGLWRADETPTTGGFFALTTDWSVNADTVTLALVVTLEGIVVPGDRIELDALGTFVVASVALNVLTLTLDTGVVGPAGYTGRVTRLVS